MNHAIRRDALGPMTWHLTGLVVILLSVAAGACLQNRAGVLDESVSGVPDPE